MHFVLSWDIQAEGDEWSEVNKAMKLCLEGYSWVKPLSTFYIVKVSSQDEWEWIKEDLKEVAKNTDLTVHFVVSPLMDGGRYDGWLPKKTWPKIRKRTD
jgi:hypothetical protein